MGGRPDGPTDGWLDGWMDGWLKKIKAQEHTLSVLFYHCYRVTSSSSSASYRPGCETKPKRVPSSADEVPERDAVTIGDAASVDSSVLTCVDVVWSGTIHNGRPNISNISIHSTEDE